MSWDLVLFNSKQKIKNPAEVDEQKLVPINFYELFEHHFSKIIRADNHCEIIGENYSIDYFAGEEPASNIMVSVYGEHGLFQLITLAKKYNLQIYDSGIGGMINLENPSENGYSNFRSYVSQILDKSDQ